MPFDILENPFAILELASDAPVATVVARARSSTDSRAAAASRTLIAPKTRLIAELGFLPGATQARVEGTLAAIGTGVDPDLGALTPLSRANVLAHLASQGRATQQQLNTLFELQQFVRGDSLELVNVARSRAGLPPADEQAVHLALDQVISSHAAAVSQAATVMPSGSHFLCDLVKAADHDREAFIPFLRQTIAAWDRSTCLSNNKDLEAASEIEDRLQERPDDKLAQSLANVIRAFGLRTLPSRELCKKLGLVHDGSEASLRKWRTLAHAIVGHHDAGEEATTILGEIVEAFGATGDTEALVVRDLEALRAQVAAGFFSVPIRRLKSAINAASATSSIFTAPFGTATAWWPHDKIAAELRDAFMGRRSYSRNGYGLVAVPIICDRPAQRS